MFGHAVCLGQLGLQGRGEQGSAGAGEHRAEEEQTEIGGCRQGGVAGDADEASDQDCPAGAPPVGQQAAHQEHPLLAESSGAKDKPDGGGV